MKSKPRDKSLSPKTVAERMDVSPSYVNKLCAAGILKSYPLSDGPKPQRRIKERDFEDFLRKRSRKRYGPPRPSLTMVVNRALRQVEKSAVENERVPTTLKAS